MTPSEKLLLGIIASVESGVTTPEDAVIELAELKTKTGIKADYMLADFQKIREEALSTFDEDYNDEGYYLEDDEEED